MLFQYYFTHECFHEKTRRCKKGPQNPAHCIKDDFSSPTVSFHCCCGDKKRLSSWWCKHQKSHPGASAPHSPFSSFVLAQMTSSGGLGGVMGTQHMLLLCVLIMSNPFSSFVCVEDKHVSLELWGPLPLLLPINPPQPYLVRMSWSLATDQERVLLHLHLGECFGSVAGKLLRPFFASLQPFC